ncbi:MAG: hypothetical protein VX152_05920 [Pseudomonadota bacterium]|nr:hypothetical protein [Pseudomonadota bacterium]
MILVVGEWLANELIVAVETWLARDYTGSLIKVIDQLSRLTSALALAQSHLDFSQLCNDFFWLGSLGHLLLLL